MTSFFYLLNRSRVSVNMAQLRDALAADATAYGIDDMGARLGAADALVSGPSVSSGRDQLPQLCRKTGTVAHTNCDAYAIVIADADILSDRCALVSAEAYWDLPIPVAAVIVTEPVDPFAYRFTNLQFCPLCLVHVKARSLSYEGLIAYLRNKGLLGIPVGRTTYGHS